MLTVTPRVILPEEEKFPCQWTLKYCVVVVVVVAAAVVAAVVVVPPLSTI